MGMLGSFWVSVRSIVQWFLGGILVLLVVPAYFIVRMFVSFKQSEFVLKWFSYAMVKVSGIQITTEDMERLDSNTSYIIVFNHTNILDLFVLHTCLPGVVRGVEKASHFKWPIYGLLLRKARQVPIQSGRGAGNARKSLLRAERLFRTGVNIAIAPEGTRSRTGLLMPFKKGAFHLGVDLQAKIIPVVLKGMDKINLKTSYKIYPGPVQVCVLPLVDCAGKTKLDVDQLKEQTYQNFVTCLGKDKVLAYKPLN